MHMVTGVSDDLKCINRNEQIDACSSPLQGKQTAFQGLINQYE